VSDGPHWTCTKGAKWRGDAPTVGNGARDHLAPGLVESQLHKNRAVRQLGQFTGTEPRPGCQKVFDHFAGVRTARSCLSCLPFPRPHEGEMDPR